MTKNELIDDVASTSHVSRRDVRKVLGATAHSIMASLAAGDKVSLRGFGSFTRRNRAPKTARNIAKGISITIGARVVPKFIPSEHFRDILNK